MAVRGAGIELVGDGRCRRSPEGSKGCHGDCRAPAAGRELAYVASRLGDWLAEGRTEREVARAIDIALERAGFSEPAFPTIVASGPIARIPMRGRRDRRT